MNLFKYDSDKNLLPENGVVNYFGPIFSPEEAGQYYTNLLENIAWENDQAIIFGKKIITKRKVAWYAEKPFEYTYSKVTKRAIVFTDVLLELKKKIEDLSGESFNSCLLNLYHNGTEGMAWHSDGEKDLKKNGAIASVTFGAERKFAFKNKESKEVVSLTLETGSLLIMKGETQNYWLHRLPPTKKEFGPRVNLTFRTIMK